MCVNNNQTVVKGLVISFVTIIFVILIYVDQSNEIFFREIKVTPKPIRLWTKDSNLNVTYYLEVQPQYTILPKRKYEDSEILG